MSDRARGLLEGLVVLVTGAGRGIGRGVAEAVAEAAGRVVLTDLDPGAARQAAAAITASGGDSLALGLDVTDRAAVAATLETTSAHWGRLDGLVNNAGTLALAPALETTAADWQRQQSVNVEALFSCSQLVARRWIDQGRGGSIVNIASNAGKVGYPNMAAYNATKAAVISLTRSLAREWAEYGINVNAVCPGGVRTAMLEEVARFLGERSGEDPARLIETMTPPYLGRHVEPLEVGRVVAFLLSEHASVIRGQAINVDGGEAPY